MKNNTIYINCNYIPKEIISALGYLPQRIWPNNVIGNVNSLLPANYCPYSKAFFSSTSKNNNTKIIMATSCDAMRRVYDNLSNNSFLIDIPRQQGRQQTNYFYQQLLDIINILPGDFSDKELINEIKKHNKIRSVLLKNLKILYNKNTKHLIHFLDNFNYYYNNPDQVTNLIKSNVFNIHKIPVLVTSSCLLDGSIISILDKAGLRPIGLDSCLGERNLNFKIKIDKNSPLLNLVQSYLNKPDCPRMMKPKKRLNEINKLYQNRNCEGIIYFVPKFCDQANYDFKYIKNWSQDKNIPILKIEGDYDIENSGQLLTRVMAFQESIKMNKRSTINCDYKSI